jgi:hypothetical protein
VVSSKYAIKNTKPTPPVVVPFKVLLADQRRDTPNWKPPHKLLALDPGGTVGWALFVDGKPERGGQVQGRNTRLEQLIVKYQPDIVVAEKFSNYPWKQESLAWSDNPTSKLIGVLEYICAKQHIKLIMQSALVAKGFCTDERLQSWNYYFKGRKHMNDAVRHAVYFLLFNKSWEPE